MIDPNHPAVEAAARVALADGWTCDTHEPEEWGVCPDCTDSHLRTTPRALNAALPHLEAATAENLARLRDTPVGRSLMAEAWDECVYEARDLGWLHGPARDDVSSRNPYEKEAPDDHA